MERKQKNIVNGKLDNLRRLEAKKNELEKEEERILKDAASRRKSEGTPTGSDDYPAAPPPLPQAPPPLGAPPSSEDNHEPSGAAQRLDALISTNLKTNGHHHPQASKKVSFASSAPEPLDESSEIKQENNEKFNKATGHTPSVIGAQEVYRDPRMKMMAQKKAEEDERKSSVTKQRDGAKLSFQEKMELFAAGNEAAREKAKISKAQREIDGENPGNR